MSCSYSPSGVVPRDKEYPTALRSKNITACKVAADSLEVNDAFFNNSMNVTGIANFDDLTVDNMTVNNNASIGNDVTIGNNLSVVNTTTTDKLVVNQDFFEPGNVKYYGAVGDGVTDDTAAFQNALASIDCIKVPPGEYVLSATLNLDVGQGISGCSPVSTRLLSSADTIVNFSSFTTYLNNISLGYIGSNFTTSTAISVSSAAFSVVIDNVRMGGSNLPAFGIVIGEGGQSEEVRVSNSVIWSKLRGFFGNGRGIAIYSTVFHVTQNTTNIIEIGAGGGITLFGVTALAVGPGITVTNGVNFLATSYNSSFYGGNVLTDAATITNPIINDGTNNVLVYAKTPILGVDSPARYSVDGTQVVGAQEAAIADLNQTITDPPSQAEVQAISDKVDELLAALREGTGHGLIAA